MDAPPATGWIVDRAGILVNEMKPSPRLPSERLRLTSLPWPRRLDCQAVLVAAAAMVATFPGRTHGLGIVTERIIQDDHLGLTHQRFGDLNFWATLLGAAFCLPCGGLFDRWGARWMFPLVVTLLALSVWGMAVAPNLPLFFLAMLLTRGFGQSALSVVSITHVGSWFGNRQGPAMGVYSVLVSWGFGLTFRWARAFSDASWTTVWQGIAWLLLALVPIFWLLTPPRPAAPAPSRDADPTPSPPAPVEETGLTLRQALRTPAFWVLGLGASHYGLVTSGTTLFHQSILESRGFDRQMFYDLGTFTPLVGLAANLVGGVLLSRLAPTKLIAVSLALSAMSLCSLPFATSRTAVYAYGFGMGVAGGLATVVFFSAWGSLYGRRELGRIQGTAQKLTVLASALGPVLVARCQTLTGSYWPIYWLLAGAAALLAVAAWLIPKPLRLDAGTAASLGA